jgi:hypothetical protein
MGNLKFKSETTIDFNDMESLEAFVRTLPLPPHQQIELLDDHQTIDADDRVEVTGTGKVVHKFSIEGEE